jgi:DNA replication protein DnaC
VPYFFARKRSDSFALRGKGRRRSIVITTNIAFKDRPRIFAGDATMTSALLDRLLHHAQTVLIEGDSYRSAKRK